LFTPNAPLYFLFPANVNGNEIFILDLIPFFVGRLEQFFGNACEAHFIFSFETACTRCSTR
jgi:hypothetical protein